MELNNFFSHQKKLNKHLQMNKNLSNYKIISRKNLTLQIKLSDLANETKCSVYWQPSDIKISKQKVLQKYIDCLEHIITIGLDRGYDRLASVVVEPNDYCLNDQFIGLLIDVNDLIISPSMDHYHTLIEDFLSLGISLGLSTEQIEEHFLNEDFCEIAL